MTAFHSWTVSAIDEFGRKFNYTQLEHPLVLERGRGMPDVVYNFMFKRATHEILEAMGTAAYADWYCEPGTIDLGME